VTVDGGTSDNDYRVKMNVIFMKMTVNFMNTIR